MDDIKRKIVDYIYEHGESEKGLLSERELAQRFAVKRNFVREILLTLEGEGLLERLPQRGYKFIRYLDDDWDSIYPIRYYVEREALHKAIERMTDSEIKKLENIFLKMKSDVENDKLDEYAAQDRKFHELIVRASQIKFLIRMFTVMSPVFFSSNRNTSYLMQDSLTKHENILLAIQRRDWPAALQALHLHLGGNATI